MRKFILAILFLCSKQVFASGNELGNGGDVFYCPGSSKVMLVDLYEATQLGKTLNFGLPGLDYRAIVKYTLARWTSLSPLRMNRYSEWLETFDSESSFVSGIELPNIPDEGILVRPIGCEIRQIAIQLKDEDLDASYKRFTINKDLWDILPEPDKAALVLHELIFREAIMAKMPVSLRVRHLTGVLMSNSTNQDYFEASKNLCGLFLEWPKYGFELMLDESSLPAEKWSCDWRSGQPDCKELKNKQKFIERFFVRKGDFTSFCKDANMGPSFINFNSFFEILNGRNNDELHNHCWDYIDEAEKFYPLGKLIVDEIHGLALNRPLTVKYWASRDAFAFESLVNESIKATIGKDEFTINSKFKFKMYTYYRTLTDNLIKMSYNTYNLTDVEVSRIVNGTNTKTLCKNVNSITIGPSSVSGGADSGNGWQYVQCQDVP